MGYDYNTDAIESEEDGSVEPMPTKSAVIWLMPIIKINLILSCTFNDDF